MLCIYATEIRALFLFCVCVCVFKQCSYLIFGPEIQDTGLFFLNFCNARVNIHVNLTSKSEVRSIKDD